MKRFLKTSILISMIALTLFLVACGCSKEISIPYGTVTRTPDLTGGANLTYSYDEKTHTAWFGKEGETIAYYSEDKDKGRSAGNRVGIKITAPTEVETYEGFKLTIYDKVTYEGLDENGKPKAFDGDNFVYIYPKVAADQMSVTITIKWNKDVEEQTYYVRIIDKTNFANA